MAGIKELSCGVQKYLWGKPAEHSLVAKFTGNSLSTSERYAELWMGTHRNAPSRVKETNQLLSEWISEDLDGRLGTFSQDVKVEKDGSLPFLLKILSVDKALSLQVHPTREHAALLHRDDPQHYPDPNHKPEMAIALTQFEGLCGFRPMEEIILNINSLSPKILSLLSSDVVDVLNSNSELSGESEQKPFLQSLFSQLINLPDSAGIILEHLESKTKKSSSDELFLRISAQHPGDRGLVCIYMLNHVTLQPGESMFLGANKIHAYFSGDCVECMACSDNVVRAGMTGKFVDADTLIGMLDYMPGTAESQKLGTIVRGDCTVYQPPVKDFAVDRIRGERKISMSGIPSPRIVLCTEGKGSLTVGECQVNLAPGSVFYVCPGQDFLVEPEGTVELFAAYSQQ